MKNMLLEYYNMDVNYIYNGYFDFYNEHYFVMKCNSSFLELYTLYECIMQYFHKKGYRIVNNKYNQMITKHFIVFVYENEDIDLKEYVYYTFRSFQIYRLDILKIKESWIEKIDSVRKEVSKYSYSFQYDKDLNALIHYYCGMAETAVALLNEILKINKKASLSLCFSLRHKISFYYHELLNPCYYDISTRSRHLLNLLKSCIVSFEEFDDIIVDCSFDIIELLYMYARCFYCSDFFDFILVQKIDKERIDYFINNIEFNKDFIIRLKEKVSKFVSLSEISWID